MVLTSKHHEAFTLWPSSVSWNWNAMDVGPHRDRVGDLADAVRIKGLTYGLHRCLFEWVNPIYIGDKASGCTTRQFPEEKTLEELKEIVSKYEPAVTRSDGDGEPLGAPEQPWRRAPRVDGGWRVEPGGGRLLGGERRVVLT